jgi:two-component system CheB/CheR fusion protein
MKDDSSSVPSVAQLLALCGTQIRGYVLILLNADVKIVAVRGGLEEALGYCEAELLGQPLDDIFTPEDRALGLDSHEVRTARASGASMDDRWHVRKDGSRVWIDGMLIALRGDDGEVVGFAKVVRDRTDLRAHIEALENRADLLAGADERKNIFVATLVHELRNPLMPLGNAAQLIRMSSNDERLRLPLQVIERQLAQLKRLIDDVMDMTRVDVGKLELRVARVSLQTALERAVTSCRPAAQERRIGLGALLPPVEIGIDVDPMRFEQIVVNLINNAIKFTQAGGQIWLKTTVESGNAVIRVDDNGKGISAEMLPRIFDLFTQESRNGEAPTDGLGIGLTLVKSLVALHRGIVEVRSDGPGRGSEFTVRLPLKQPGPPADPPAGDEATG